MDVGRFGKKRVSLEEELVQPPHGNFSRMRVMAPGETMLCDLPALKLHPPAAVSFRTGGSHTMSLSSEVRRGTLRLS